MLFLLDAVLKLQREAAAAERPIKQGPYTPLQLVSLGKRICLECGLQNLVEDSGILQCFIRTAHIGCGTRFESPSLYDPNKA